MDYKELILFQLEELGLKSQMEKLPEDMVLTADDMIELDRSIGYDIVENENMLARSEMLASRCSLM